VRRIEIPTRCRSTCSGRRSTARSSLATYNLARGRQINLERLKVPSLEDPAPRARVPACDRVERAERLERIHVAGRERERRIVRERALQTRERRGRGCREPHRRLRRRRARVRAHVVVERVVARLVEHDVERGRGVSEARGREAGRPVRRAVDDALRARRAHERARGERVARERGGAGGAGLLRAKGDERLGAEGVGVIVDEREAWIREARDGLQLRDRGGDALRRRRGGKACTMSLELK
jgi:hypothetical protein